ncbi:MAG: zinc ABC transporter substrate-binding protein [Anaerolineales bacterium]|nr:zinc ABC transporter substrate-binding protein [Anaerolineales bacterium]
MIVGILILVIFGVSCSGESVVSSDLEGDNVSKLQVVATTSLIGDVAAEIGGEWIDLEILLGPGSNPHSFQPSPQDVIRISEAEIIFANGFNLEYFLEDMIENAGGEGEVVVVSRGIEGLYYAADGDHDHGDDDHEDENSSSEEAVDPHVWLNPHNVLIWTENIEAALTARDPDHGDQYRQNAAVYREELVELDRWIREQLEKIPSGQRKVVTDHQSFSYFAEEYGFESVGAVISAPTTEAQPSGRELAELEDQIRARDVQVMLVGKDFDPTLAARIAEDTGIQVVSLYFGSLTGQDGPAPTYLDFMRYNVNAIIDAMGKK